MALLNSKVEASEDKNLSLLKGCGQEDTSLSQKGAGVAASTPGVEGGRALGAPLLLPFPFQETGGEKSK